jgi:hypothetical protein
VADGARGVETVWQWMSVAARRRLGVVLGSMALVSAAGLVTIGGGAIALAHGGLLAPGATVTPALLVVAGLATADVARRRSSLQPLAAPARAKLAGIS